MVLKNNTDNERKIQKKLALLLWGNSEVIVSNMVCGLGNNDLTSLTKSGFVIEYEIKCTAGDFYADFSKTFKHFNYNHVFLNGPNGNDVPNKFWYCMKDFKLAKKVEKDVPEYAGLMTPTGYIIKQAPLIHSQKCSDYVRNQMWKRLKSAYWFRNLKTETDFDVIDDLIESKALDLGGKAESCLDKIHNELSTACSSNLDEVVNQIMFLIEEYNEIK